MRNIIINTTAISTTDTGIGSNRAFDIEATRNCLMRLYLYAKHALAKAHDYALRMREEWAGQMRSEHPGLERSLVRSSVVPVLVPVWSPILALPQQNVS